MDWFVKAFLKASVVWLSLGVTLGLAMGVHPAWTVYRPVHLHALLLGFVTMMIYGVGYHVFPRFTGRPLRSARAPIAHWWLANTGLALMAVGFAGRARGAAYATAALAVGGTASAVGAYIFAYTVWGLLSAHPALLTKRAMPVRTT